MFVKLTFTFHVTIVKGPWYILAYVFPENFENSAAKPLMPGLFSFFIMYKVKRFLHMSNVLLVYLLDHQIVFSYH